MKTTPEVPDGYQLAENGETPDEYITEDGSIVTDPYDDNGEVGSDLWGVKADSFYEEDWDDSLVNVPFYDMDHISTERAKYRLTTAQASARYDQIVGYNDV